MTRHGGTVETPRAWCDFGLPVCPGQFDTKRRPETAETNITLLITQRWQEGRQSLQFKLQFTAVQEGPRGTSQGGRSRVNRSGRPRPELLMRLGFTCSSFCRICKMLPAGGSRPRGG